MIAESLKSFHQFHALDAASEFGVVCVTIVMRYC